MKLPKISKYARQVVLSFACPILALCAILVYQDLAHGEFWRSMTPDTSAAGAMMAVGEVIELCFSVMVGCLAGIVFAALSLRSRGRLRVLSLVALLFNGVPFVLLLALWIKGRTSGF
jgi:hypothetical protein